MQLNSTTQHARCRKCERLPPINFLIFTFKNMTWWTYLISFTVQYCFLFHFASNQLVSLIWFLQIWVVIICFWHYDQLVHFNKEINANILYSVIVSGNILNISTVHLNGIRHLIWHYLSKPVLGGHSVLSGHYNIPRGFLLNTGFNVL